VVACQEATQVETTLHTSTNHPEVTVLEVRGDVDPGERGGDRLCGLLRSLLGCEQRHIVVDLSEVGYLVSRALGEILAVLARVRLRGGDLVLVATPGAVLSALEAVRVGEITRIFDSRDEAIEHLAAQAGESSE